MTGYRKFADRAGENSDSTSAPAKAAKVAKIDTETLAALASLAEADRQTRKSADDPAWWRDWLEERAAIRQYDGGYSRFEAEHLAWQELECHQHRLCGERVSPELCAGCLQAIDPAQAVGLDDGCVVHLACVARYGRRWRKAASAALAALGLKPPDDVDPARE